MSNKSDAIKNKLKRAALMGIAGGGVTFLIFSVFKEDFALAGVLTVFALMTLYILLGELR
ncbi:hypothetical protein ACFL6Y_09160 [Elusimicrobiota bacterium]